MQKKMPLVSIIIVNYNGKRFLKDCFDSLPALNYPKNRLEIIMIDNSSHDDSIEYVKRQYPRIKVFKNDTNNYCRANNLGITKSKGEYIALLNNDTKADKNWLIELIKVISADDEIGAVGSKILFPDGRLQGAGHYEFPDFYWSDRGFKEENKGQYSVIEEIKSLSHCAILYRRKCLDSIGLLDEDFNMFVEDVDMSIRARQKGWRMFYVPLSIAYHKFHGSANDDLSNFFCERNRLLLIAKHYPQKLADALFGKGHFTVLNKNNELIKILPDVFSKLAKHHTQATVTSVLPGIFEELNKILNLEKDYLIKQLNGLEKAHSHLLQEVIPDKDTQLSEKNQLLEQKDTEITNLNDKINQNLGLISEKNQLLEQKDAQIAGLRDQINQNLSLISNKDTQLSEKNQFLEQKDAQIGNLNNEINAIYNSETYRFIARSIWPLLNIIKHIKIKPKKHSQKHILIIKPNCVGTEETERVLRHFRLTNQNSFMLLIANLFEEDYAKLCENQDIDERILFSPKCNKLTKVAFFKLLFKLRRKKIDEAIILVGNPVYHGYRKAKLLAVLSGANKVRLYFLNIANFASPYSFTLFRIIWRSFYSSALLFCIFILFFTFIIAPQKFKKIFRK